MFSLCIFNVIIIFESSFVYYGFLARTLYHKVMTYLFFVLLIIQQPIYYIPFIINFLIVNIWLIFKNFSHLISLIR
ncbi:hypothetical protein ADU89_08700 [Clostridium botulinum]|nr:hypothetical protein ADU89_08700 [Clostridium botulinum]